GVPDCAHQNNQPRSAAGLQYRGCPKTGNATQLRAGQSPEQQDDAGDDHQPDDWSSANSVRRHERLGLASEAIATHGAPPELNHPLGTRDQSSGRRATDVVITKSTSVAEICGFPGTNATAPA